MMGVVVFEHRPWICVWTIFGSGTSRGRAFVGEKQIVLGKQGRSNTDRFEKFSSFHDPARMP
jgi:hypothetical protein